MRSTQVQNSTSARIFVGCSGWHYDDWRGRLYPVRMGKTRWLTHYSSIFDTVELNNTFYRLPGQSSVSRWHDETGSGFVFAVKGSRYITHIRRLVDVGSPVQEFTQRLAGLGSKLGPLLWQLPPQLSRDDALLEDFLHVLPPTSRHVIEFRHPSWWNNHTYAMLQEYHTAVCLIDTPSFKSHPIATTDFIYIRFHGAEQMYSSCYQDEQLCSWAGNIRSLGEGMTTVYAYFNNDTNGYAVKNALTLRALLTTRSIFGQSELEGRPSERAHPLKPAE
ncbi:MAG: DUF72 domain-containing protein [Dehalococcoidia bacterium]|nr:DUF72 domain-containing protein [Dehalococcoidia bacterium]